MMRLAARLPLRVLHALGSLLGWAMYGISPTYRRRLRENLEQAGYTDARTRREAIAEAGKMIAESPKLWLRPREEILRLVRGFEGLEEAARVHAAGRGIVFLTPHFGCFEITAQAAAEHVPLTVLYRAPKVAWLRPLMERGRSGRNIALASADLGGVRQLLSALKRRETVGILPDQVPGEGEGEWADFFGRPAYTMTLAAKLIERGDVACFLAIGRRLPRGAGYALRVAPLPSALPGESGTRRINRALEAAIRECPGQYLWGYNRYKKPRGRP
jgi:KDO2-lipid IV(A) lauroyltransferase